MSEAELRSSRALNVARLMFAHLALVILFVRVREGRVSIRLPRHLPRFVAAVIEEHPNLFQSETWEIQMSIRLLPSSSLRRGCMSKVAFFLPLVSG
jgi:hypothetical protein